MQNYYQKYYFQSSDNTEYSAEFFNAWGSDYIEIINRARKIYTDVCFKSDNANKLLDNLDDLCFLPQDFKTFCQKLIRLKAFL